MRLLCNRLNSWYFLVSSSRPWFTVRLKKRIQLSHRLLLAHLLIYTLSLIVVEVKCCWHATYVVFSFCLSCPLSLVLSLPALLAAFCPAQLDPVVTKPLTSAPRPESSDHSSANSVQLDGVWIVCLSGSWMLLGHSKRIMGFQSHVFQLDIYTLLCSLTAK